MPGVLRQATAAQVRALGPFLDDTDFKTPETALTIANTDIKLVINGAASANKNSGGGTHRVNGVYGVTFDATDTATVGEIEVSVLIAGACIVFDKFQVIEEAAFDAQYAAAAPGYVVDQPVNATKVGGTAQTGRDLGASVLLSPGTGTGQVDLVSGRVKTTGNVKKNTALATFPFMMTDSTNHAPVTGKTVTVTRSINGAAFGAGTLANVIETGVGMYACDFGAGDLNGECIVLRCTASGCDDTFERIITSTT